MIGVMGEGILVWNSGLGQIEARGATNFHPLET